MLLAIWWLWPLPSVAGSHLGYAGGALVGADVHLIVWALAWCSHILPTAPWHLFHANTFFPATDSLAYSEHFLGLVPLFAPTWWATGNPTLAVNLLVLATYPLSGLGMYLLARRFTGAPAAALAGFFYAFCPARYAALGSLHLLGVQYFPLTLLLTERWLEKARVRDATLLGTALVLQALSSFYVAYALVLLYGPYLLLALWWWRARIDRRRLTGLAIVFAIVAGVMIPLSLPYLRLKQLGVIPSFGTGDPRPPWFLPEVSTRLTLNYFRGSSVGPVGFVLVLLALASWRGARWPRLLALVPVVVGTLAALGPEVQVGARTLWTPYRLLVDWIPGFGTIRVPLRLLSVAHVGIALLAGLGFERLLGRTRLFGWPAAATASALALWTFVPLPPFELHEQTTPETLPASYRWLAAGGEGRALLELPAAGIAGAAQRMYLSTFHWLPLIDGYSGYYPDTPGYVYGLARRLPAEDALQALVDAVDVGWVLVHRDALPPESAARWSERLPSGLETTAAWDGDLLLRVTRPAMHDQRARLLSSTETLDGTPLAPLGAQCPGRLEIARLPPAPWQEGKLVPLVVSIRNDGQAPWPAHGLLPRHLVQVRACIAPPDHLPCVAAMAGLPADVPAGASVTVTVPVRPAPGRGVQSLEVSLVQIGDGSLERCGVQPLRLPVAVGLP